MYFHVFFMCFHRRAAEIEAVALQIAASIPLHNWKCMFSAHSLSSTSSWLSFASRLKKALQISFVEPPVSEGLLSSMSSGKLHRPPEFPPPNVGQTMRNRPNDLPSCGPLLGSPASLRCPAPGVPRGPPRRCASTAPGCPRLQRPRERRALRGRRGLHRPPSCGRQALARPRSFKRALKALKSS